eukprot:scaffold319536_cov32-Tisochrysis_lutea.AAC.1
MKKGGGISNADSWCVLGARHRHSLGLYLFASSSLFTRSHLVMTTKYFTFASFSSIRMKSRSRARSDWRASIHNKTRKASPRLCMHAGGGGQ